MRIAAERIFALRHRLECVNEQTLRPRARIVAASDLPRIAASSFGRVAAVTTIDCTRTPE